MPEHKHEQPRREPRAAWQKPRVDRMRAGEAENTALGNQPDGSISLGVRTS